MRWHLEHPRHTPCLTIANSDILQFGLAGGTECNSIN
jgi:hypothetical protein